ncbi:MAG: hypothetical protein JWN93_1885 [Hyphomicrobiales bacterium]|nr:hypothetical protein [Hyphomicrobiales bacterium]
MKSFHVALAACALGLALAAPTSAGALPLAPQKTQVSESLIVDVQARRGRPAPRQQRRRGVSQGGVALGIGAAALIGVIGAAAMARQNRVYEQPYGYPPNAYPVHGGYAPYGYEDPYAPHHAYSQPRPPRPSPFCHIEQQQVFDAYGNRAGARNIRVCR